MSNVQNVQEFEKLCFDLYESGDPVRTVEAHKALAEFGEDPASVDKCRAVLEQSQMPTAQFLAAMNITNNVSRMGSSLMPLDFLELRDFVLNCIANHEYSHVVILELSKLLARITKMNWFECDASEKPFMQDLLQHAIRFIQQGGQQYSEIGAQILLQLVSEMDRSESCLPITRHRKVSTSFRDTNLLQIFQLSMANIQKMSGLKTMDLCLLGLLLQVSRACLNFDFIGACVDESTEDFRTVQIPNNWRDTLCDPSTLQLYFSVYLNTSPPISEYALGCLVHLASVRRTLFTNDQRMVYLTSILQGIVEIVRTSHGLDHQVNFHECCRILARLKTNYQLSELVKVENYNESMDIIANFTVNSLQQWHWSPNSIHYILSLWERLIASVPFVRTENPHNLEVFSPRISRAYVQSRFESVRLCLEDAALDPLDDPEALEAELAQFAVIARFQYGDSVSMIFELFEPAAQAYIGAIGVLDPQSIDYQVVESQMVWLLYIVSSLIGGKTGSNAGDDEDNLDGDLTCKVLQIIGAVDNQLAAAGAPRSEILDAAFIYFFQQFRTTYIGDQVHKSIKIYMRLDSTLGLKDDCMVLSVFARKIVDYLEYWTRSNRIIESALKLLSDLCNGHTSVRKLVSIEAIQFILAHHSEFRFLSLVEDTRHRTTYYTAIGRILTLDASDDQGRFEEFMIPFGTMFRQVNAEMSSPSQSNILQIKQVILGLARDLRGLLQTCANKPAYVLFFEWFFPEYIPTFYRGLEMFADEPRVSVPILKFISDFVFNKNTRLNFGVSSAHGILLFREASKFIAEYGQRVLALQVPHADQIYLMKYKGITVIYRILLHVLSGEYINFGVFQLYGDSALDVAFETFFKLVLSTPYADLMAYTKLSKAYYALLVLMTRDHMRSISRLDAQSFTYVSGTVLEGLRSPESALATQSCSTLDSIITFAVTGRLKARPDAEALAVFDLINASMDLYAQMLRDLLGTIVFEECKHQWSVSRPLLGLVIVLPSVFMEEQQRIISMQPAFKQGLFSEAFAALMDGVGDTLTAKNRDMFTQNLAVFRRDITNQPKSAAQQTTMTEAMNSVDYLTRYESVESTYY